MTLSHRPIYPFLLAVYPVMSLLAENVDWIASASDIILPVVLSLGVVGTGWLLSSQVTAERLTRGEFTLVWILFWLWYGPFSQLLSWLTGKPALYTHTFGFPLWILLLAVVALIASRSRAVSRSTQFLNLFSAVLLLFPFLTLLKGPSTQALALTRYPLPEHSPVNTESLPDIYFLILDGYSSSQGLTEIWDHDNGAFEDSLRETGFIVPTQSRSNYVHTHLSLASMLNWTHLLHLTDMFGDGRDRSYTYEMIRNNRAARFLKSIGYDFVFFPTTYSATRQNRMADIQLPEPPLREDSFLFAWLNQTSATPLILFICWALECQTPRFPYPPETAREFELKFKLLARSADREKPVFVLAHVLLPHPPFVFEADCTHRDPLWPISGDPSAWDSVRPGYVGQIACLNRMLLGLVDQVLAKSRTPPIIILQADHGGGAIQLDPLTGQTIPMEELDKRTIDDRIHIFAAYYLPRHYQEVLYDSITPVNVLPIIFNKVFETRIPLSEDTTFWSEPWQPYIFEPIDSRASDKTHDLPERFPTERAG